MKKLVVVFDPDADIEFPYSWRIREGEHWMGAEARGDFDQLKSAAQTIDAPISLLLPTRRAVLLRKDIAASEKRVLRKIMPFELEEQIIEDIDDLHFVYGAIETDQVTVGYSREDWLDEVISEFDEAELNLQSTCLEAQLLNWQEGTLSIRWLDDSSTVDIRYGEDLACAVSADSLEMAIVHLKGEKEWSEINLYAPSHEQLDCLQELLPEQLVGLSNRHQWNRWESLETPDTLSLNWLQGVFGRSLPIAKWWQEWKWPTYAGAAALVIFLITGYGQILNLKETQNQYLADSEATYRQVVPSGALVDPERQLKNQLKKYGVSEKREYPSALTALASVTPMLESAAGVKVKNIYYFNGELRLNIETANFQQIESLRTAFANNAIRAELVNSSAFKDGHQARMRISL